MTCTGAWNAGLFRALKIRVRRTRRRMTKAPPFEFTKKAMTPGAMAARSIMFVGAKTNFLSLVKEEGRLMGSNPTTMSWSSALSKISDLTAQQVRNLAMYSTTKIARQASSTPFRMTHRLSVGSIWHSGTVPRMKAMDETMMTESIVADIQLATLQESGLSIVR